MPLGPCTGRLLHTQGPSRIAALRAMPSGMKQMGVTMPLLNGALKLAWPKSGSSAAIPRIVLSLRSPCLGQRSLPCGSA